MVSLESCQDAGADQKVVHQGIDGNHAGADLVPEVQAFRGGQQDAGQAHGQDLVRNAIDLPERSDHELPAVGQADWGWLGHRPLGIADRSSRPGRRRQCRERTRITSRPSG